MVDHLSGFVSESIGMFFSRWSMRADLTGGTSELHLCFAKNLEPKIFSLAIGIIFYSAKALFQTMHINRSIRDLMSKTAKPHCTCEQGTGIVVKIYRLCG